MTNRRDTCPWWKTVRCPEIAPDTLQVTSSKSGWWCCRQVWNVVVVVLLLVEQTNLVGSGVADKTSVMSK